MFSTPIARLPSQTAPLAKRPPLIAFPLQCRKKDNHHLRTFHSRSTAVSAAPQARTLPASASVVVAPVKMPSALRWPTLIWTAAWSLAVISLLVHELLLFEIGNWLERRVGKR